MSPIEILGSLLGGKSQGGGADILKDILGGGGGRPSPQPRSAPTGSSSNRSVSANDLEDMLGVGSGQTSRTAPRPSPSPTPRSTTPAPTSTTNHQGFPNDIFGQRTRNTQVNLAVPRPELSPDDEAVLLIRAMINSAKIDGEITQDEQQFILDKVGDTSPDTIQFLRAEFARQLNLKEFADSIPVGLEQKVYLLSLMAIKLDSKQEADYLRSLAKSLRIDPDTVNQIHSQNQAPVLYS